MNNSLRYLIYLISFFAITSFGFSSCVTEEDYANSSNINLKFSNDTIRFDTVFTTLGSVTKQIRVYNNENKPLKIDQIRLGAGANSFYRLNVDGNTNIVVNDVVINAKDSMFIFVRVTINPNNQSNPLLVSDSIIFSFNGKEQYVQLEAYGQDAYYHVADKWAYTLDNNGNRIDSLNYSLAEDKGLQSGCIVNGNSLEWKNDKPHIIFGSLIVNSNKTLTLSEGTKIHLNSKSVFFVWSEASLKVNGSTQNNVIFQGMRKDDYYSQLPGQWGQIWFQAGSKNNVLNNVTIKNGTIGIIVDSCVTNDIPTVDIQSTKIENMSVYGIWSRGGHINAVNTLVQNTGKETVALTIGGKYQFVNCTFANYWSYNSRRSNTTLFLQNYYYDNDNNLILRPITECNFYNTIIYGSNEDEIMIDKKEGAELNYLFESCLLLTKSVRNEPPMVSNCIFNQDPLFNYPQEGDFRIKSSSPAIGKGNGSWNAVYPNDIIGNFRQFPPTIGAYEYYPIATRK
ncbi:MAG: hypothetical protein PHG98_01510 [Bacteroidales bacterium]|nr:hypothetical protein [Bacteroidales bacterium]MDD4738607.1 hypothetical protein [Bacteroidales bacterium]